MDAAISSSTAYLTRCPKITYPSRRLALDVSKQNGMRVYRCGTCRHWHLTSSDKQKPNKRGRRS